MVVGVVVFGLGETGSEVPCCTSEAEGEGHGFISLWWCVALVSQRTGVAEVVCLLSKSPSVLILSVRSFRLPQYVSPARWVAG